MPGGTIETARVRRLSMVETLVFARVEWWPRSGSSEETVKHDQGLTAPEIPADDVMTDLGDRPTTTGGRLI